jgi:hypothetical protein
LRPQTSATPFSDDPSPGSGETEARVIKRQTGNATDQRSNGLTRPRFPICPKRNQQKQGDADTNNGGLRSLDCQSHELIFSGRSRDCVAGLLNSSGTPSHW